MKVKKIENFLVEGTTVALCWGINCYGPSVFTCPNTVSIAASATDESFRGDYSHGNISGTSIITYVFFNENDANDSCYVVVKYDNGTTSIPSLNLQIAEPYPNPAQGFISFDNQNAVFGMSLSVYNTLGKRLKVIRLEGANGITLVNTSDLDPGMYFYEYFDGTSVIKNGKFFVTR